MKFNSQALFKKNSFAFVALKNDIEAYFETYFGVYFFAFA